MRKQWPWEVRSSRSPNSLEVALIKLVSSSCQCNIVSSTLSLLHLLHSFLLIVHCLFSLFYAGSLVNLQSSYLFPNDSLMSVVDKNWENEIGNDAQTTLPFLDFLLIWSKNAITSALRLSMLCSSFQVTP